MVGLHGVGEADVIINAGVSGPGVVKRALEKVRGESFDVVAETVKKQPLRLLSYWSASRSNGQERLGADFGIGETCWHQLLQLAILWLGVLEEMGPRNSWYAWDDGRPRSLNDR